MTDQRFEELLQTWLDDEISEQEFNELIELVSADDQRLAELRRQLMISDRLSQYEDALRSEDRFLSALQMRIHAADDSERFVQQVVASAKDVERNSSDSQLPPTPASNNRRRINYGLASWITAAIALSLLVSILIRGRQGETEPDDSPLVVKNAELDEPSDRGVAVLTRVTGLVGDEIAGLIPGSTIPPGELTWEEGIVQLEFYCGATVVAEGPASLEVLDASRVVCRSGRLRAHVPKPARGFAVLAPTVELVDLGTEFGIEVGAAGKTEVHVFDGAVELYDAESNRAQDTRRELTAGDAVSVGRDGEAQAITVRDGDFVTPNRLSKLTSARRTKQLGDWQKFRDSLQNDPRVAAYFPFNRNETDDRTLVGYSAKGGLIEGAIVGCEWSRGRWPDKAALQFKRPGDRVRVSVPGEFESLTYSVWLRVDGLDRRFSSLLLADGFTRNRPHWQIRKDGPLILGMRHSDVGRHDYQTDSIFDLYRLGQWIHLATVYDNKESRVVHYVDGESVSQEPLQDNANGLLSIGNATIGNWSMAGAEHRASKVRNLNGRIDELIVFGQALDDQEIRDIYRVGRP